MTGPRRSIVAALGAALLLALPVAALAQSKPRTPALAPPAPSPARQAPAATYAAEPLPEAGAWRAGLLAGYENDSDAELSGLRVQVELERDLVALGARGQLSFVGAAAWFHGTRSDSFPALGNTLSVDTTAELFELVPAFRTSFALAPRLRLFAQVGAGGAWTKTKTESSLSTAGAVVTTVKSDAWAGVVSFSLGGSFQLNERLRLGVELPAVHRRYGDAVAQTLSFSATAAYAF